MTQIAIDPFQIVAVALSGCAVAALCWVACQHAARFVMRAAAHDDARREPWEVTCQHASMPIAWRVVWPVIERLGRLLSVFGGPVQTPARPLALDRAGLPPGIQAVHISAARGLAASLAAVLTLALSTFPGTAPPGEMTVLIVGLSAVGAGACTPGLWLRARTRRRKVLIERELPFFLDLLALCVQGGLSIQGAMHESVRFGPQGVLRDEIARVLAELRAGQSRAQAFEALARRTGSRNVRASVGAVLQAEALGISLGSQLKEQAKAQGMARFEQAERQALKAPVKLLLPLMVFIFPCTFLVIGFPIVMSMRQAFS